MPRVDALPQRAAVASRRAVDLGVPASHQTAIAQLANAYCGQLIGTQSLRDAFFGAGWMAASTRRRGVLRRERQRQPRHRHQCAGQQCGGRERYAGPAGAVRSEVDALLTHVPTLKSGVTVATATTAACAAVLGSRS